MFGLKIPQIVRQRGSTHGKLAGHVIQLLNSLQQL